MADWMKETALQMAEALAAGEITSQQLVEESLARVKELNPTVNAFIAVDEEGALATAQEVDRLRKAGEDLHPLAGVPVAVKDNIVTKGLETTCGSEMLVGWVPPYDATVVTRLKEARLPIIGKTNLDEFAMGSSTKTSQFGPTLNPWDAAKSPGGSSGGSAAAVASYMVPFALGTDTGGSVRQPAAFTGIVGVKPTYGRVSRYGAVALASSMDQVGPVARTVSDAAALQDLVGGHDPFDSTSFTDEADVLTAARTFDDALDGLKVGVIKELAASQDEVATELDETVAALEAAGAAVTEVSLPSAPLGIPAYYLVMPAEAYSNLGRFDGVRFGNRVMPEGEDPTAREMTALTRGERFGTEVKRRIILGAYVLSSEMFEDGYGGAGKVRAAMTKEFADLFDTFDVLIAPTTPTTAFRLDEELSPVAMYLSDIATVPANLAGIPALSMPNGVDEDGMPTSVQFFAPAMADERLYAIAAATEAAIADRVVSPPFEVNLDSEGDA